jgi:hypothetical protein
LRRPRRNHLAGDLARAILPAVQWTARIAAEAARETAHRTSSSTRQGRDRWQGRPAARAARLRRRNAIPLPSLYALHPEARALVRRDAGLRTVLLDEIVGTAVAGPAQRGSDFLPLPAFRSGNWQDRWARLRSATDRLVVLPPIDVIYFGEGFWVEDGHNRVAAALYAGQVAIDANVTELVPPGGHAALGHASLAPTLETTREIRGAAGSGFAAQTAPPPARRRARKSDAGAAEPGEPDPS